MLGSVLRGSMMSESLIGSNKVCPAAHQPQASHRHSHEYWIRYLSIPTLAVLLGNFDELADKSGIQHREMKSSYEIAAVLWTDEVLLLCAHRMRLCQLAGH